LLLKLTWVNTPNLNDRYWRDIDGRLRAVEAVSLRVSSNVRPYISGGFGHQELDQVEH